MSTRTLDVALRIATDLDGAVQDLRKMEDAQKRVELATSGLQRAHTKLAAVQADGKATADQLAKAKDGVTRAELALSTATERATKAQAAQSTGAKAATTAQTALATATQKTAAVQQRAGLSAGELRNAQRQLPAQITDIVTSLASGQSVFMVAIQQGGQLKDSWGGIVPAGRALLGAISPMVVGLSAGAAAFGAIALAGFQFAQERQEITNTLLQTGNYANASVQEIEALAESLADLDSVTAGGARDALLQVAQSGRFTGEQLELVATAAARMEAATGQSIDTTVQKFQEIARSPVEALLKLNETEHFLTETQLERIRTLVEEGREQDAAAEGARIYADRLNDIADAAEDARPHLSRLWRDAKEGASAAWQETKNFAEFLAAAGEQYRNMPWWKKIGPGGGFTAMQALYGAQPAAPLPAPASVAGAVNSKAEIEKEKQRRQSEQDWDRLQQSNLSKQQKLEAEIVEIKKNGLALGKSDAEVQAQITAARARYKESLPKGKKAGKTDAQQDQEAAARELDNLEKQIALTATLADGERQVSNEARVAYEIKEGAFRLSSAATQQELLAAAKRRDAQLAEIEAEQKRKQETEKTRRQYEQLRQELQTPIEAAIEDITNKIKVLNETLAAGLPIAGGYDAALQRIFDQSFTKAPELQLPNAGADDPTGFLRDQAIIDEAREQQQAWYDEQLAMLEQFRLDKGIKQDVWNAKEQEVEAKQAAALTALKRAERDLQVNATQEIFDGMASIMRSAAGEQSKAYRVLFAISKGFAIATATLKLGEAIANASAMPWPTNLPLIAAAVAQGAQVASLIASAVYAPQGYAVGGRIVGPGTRTSDSVPIMASVDEHMIRASSATQPGARAFLDDFNDRGMPALYDWTQVGAYAEGGAITESMEPRARFGTPSASPVNLKNDMAMYLYQDIDALAGALAKHPAMRQAIVAETSENGQAIQMSWGSGG